MKEGILERKRKAGTKVKSPPTRRAQFSISIIHEEIANMGAAYRYILIERDTITAPGWLRSRVSIAKGQKVLRVKCMHFADNTPYQLEERWINLAAVPNAANCDFKDIGPNGWLMKEVPFTEV